MNKTLNLPYHGIFCIIWHHIKVFTRSFHWKSMCPVIWRATRKEKPSRSLETVILCEVFCGNFKRKVSSSLYYHTISVINTHNRNILYLSPTIGRRTCNCINIPQCPLQQRCLSNNILYQASITPIGENSETKVYYGICKTTFKLRYTNHKKSFNHRNASQILSYLMSFGE